MVKLLYPIVLLTFICLPSWTYSQDIPPLAKTLEKTFEEKEPKWKILRPYRQMNPPVMHLKSKQGDVLIYFWLMDSQRTAKEVFDGNAIALRNSLGKRKKESKLSNFGDDNHLFRVIGGGLNILDFRIDNTYISISAPSDVVAKRFARYVIEQILANKPMQNADK